MNLKRKEIQYFLLVKKKTAVPSIWVVHVSEILNISCHGGWESETLAQVLLDAGRSRQLLSQGR